MANNKRRLGRGLGSLFPEQQGESKASPIDVFFSEPPKKEVSAEGEVHEGGMPEAGRSEAGRSEEVGTPVDLFNGDVAESLRSTDAVSDARTENLASSARTKNGVQSSDANNASDNVSRETFEDDDVELVPVPGASYAEISVSDIIPNRKQPREIFDEDELAELAASIAEVGVLQPIVVRPVADEEAANLSARYELIMGERRWRATQQAGLAAIPAIIRHTEDSELLRDALLENLHRSNLNALEEAAAYQQLIDDFQITQDQLSKRIARSRPQITNTLRLLKLPGLVQRRVAAGVISAGHARALLGLKDPAEMEQVAQRIVAEGLSVRQVEEIVALGEGASGAPLKRKRVSRYPEEMGSLANRLADRFETRVKVNLGATKGRISIDFASVEDLNRILQAMQESPVEIEGEAGEEARD